MLFVLVMSKKSSNNIVKYTLVPSGEEKGTVKMLEEEEKVNTAIPVKRVLKMLPKRLEKKAEKTLNLLNQNQKKTKLKITEPDLNLQYSSGQIGSNILPLLVFLLSNTKQNNMEMPPDMAEFLAAVKRAKIPFKWLSKRSKIESASTKNFYHVSA